MVAYETKVEEVTQVKPEPKDYMPTVSASHKPQFGMYKECRVVLVIFQWCHYLRHHPAVLELCCERMWQLCQQFLN